MISFPTPTTDGQTCTTGGRTWAWNATLSVWEAIPTPGLSALDVWRNDGHPGGTLADFYAFLRPLFSVSDTPPTSPAPVNGNTWMCSVNGQFYVYYKPVGYAGVWVSTTSPPATVWGGIGGTLANQADIVAALAGKLSVTVVAPADKQSTFYDIATQTWKNRLVLISDISNAGTTGQQVMAAATPAAAQTVLGLDSALSTCMLTQFY